ncbi:Intein N-terminal splicing region [uncultured Caudovirales phage]|uniref:DNA 5'-3' helicase DnaB n=1 Tax=uncultured Caudovirales phage TaxID=2100421 RepID=A0A6J5NUF0_9CAUD|nr:Intein N-terminal splicing region [uncultured Caudovirales phage]
MVNPSNIIYMEYNMNTNWIEKNISIGEIQELLNDYEVEIDSPDGWVGVNFFIDKGEWDEYVLKTENGFEVKCNEDHLFKTHLGWVSAKNMTNPDSLLIVNTVNGESIATVTKTGNKIPIVDINVNHENHRYYTNGVESHNTGVGKSLFMCHCAAANLNAGLNVLYITLEMAEERIAERIDANLLDIPLDELGVIPQTSYENKMNRLKAKTKGKLIIKEYPTASAGSANFRHLLNELKIKKNFQPDIIYIDYLNICMSSRIRQTASVNSYTLVKAIAEELRGLAVEFDVPVVSATQTTRSGYCLDLETTVITQSGKKTISDIVVGDEVFSNIGWNTVKTVFPTVKKKMYRITTESGKEIICSEDHLFPTEDGEKNIKSGLCLEDKLFINKNEV